MLLTFTEIVSKKPVAINPHKIVSVFVLEETDKEETKQFAGETVIVLDNGNLIVEEDLFEAIGRINAELKNS